MCHEFSLWPVNHPSDVLHAIIRKEPHCQPARRRAIAAFFVSRPQLGRAMILDHASGCLGFARRPRRVESKRDAT